MSSRTSLVAGIGVVVHEPAQVTHRAAALSWLAASALVLVAASGCGGDAGADPKQRQRPASPAMITTTVATAAPTTAAPPPTTAAALPGDDDPVPAAPARSSAPRGPEPRTLTVTGRIEIPRIGLSHTTYEGVALSTIDHGPSHWPGTALPGQPGNTVFAGHRVTHSHPFLDIDRVAVGDQVIFTNDAGRHVYEVTETLVVGANDVWIANPTPGSTFTIFGCHPKHSARQRYVVRGRLVSSAAPTPSEQAPAPGGGAGAPAPTTSTTVSPLCLLCLLQK